MYEKPTVSLTVRNHKMSNVGLTLFRNFFKSSSPKGGQGNKIKNFA